MSIPHDEFQHYGVLGMKWGVRRYQPYPKGKHGTFLGQSRDEDIVIKKGTKAYRLQEGKELKPGQTYISLDKIDHFNYVMSTAAKAGGLTFDLEDGKGHSVRMKLEKDIIAPSYSATMDAFIKTVSDMEGPKNFSKNAFDNPTSTYGKTLMKEMRRDLRNVNINDAMDRAYESFSSQLMKDTEARTRFFNILKRQGYNAIIDENDKHFGNGFTEAPIILFDSSNLKIDSTRAITNEDIDYFQDLYFGVGNDPKKKGFDKSKDYWEREYLKKKTK